MSRGRGVAIARWAAVGVCAFLYAHSASAADMGFPWLSEVRIGGASSLPIGGGATNQPYSASMDLQALFSPLPAVIHPYNDGLSWLFTPRPMIGTSISLEGRTDTAYAGFAWDAPVYGPYFAEFTLGGLVHDQTLNVLYSDRPSPLTTRFLFHESFAIGRDLGPTWRIMAFLDHASNGDLASGNVGINRVGILLGARLGPPSESRTRPLPVKADLSNFSWAGPYIGFNAALAGTQTAFKSPSGSFADKSVALGGQAGWNWQLGAVVLGVEADYDVQNLTGTVAIPAAGTGVSATSHWLVTSRGRLGVVLPMPFAPYQFLVYGTGGAAFTDLVNGYCVSDCSADSGAYYDQPQTRVGWTGGAGVDFPLAPNVSAQLQYLYVDFGNVTFSNPAAANEQFDFTEQILRGGMNFKLN